MNTLDSKAVQLTERISLAFADTVQPLEEASVRGFIGGDNEREEVADYYKGKRWSEVKFAEDINEHNRDPGALNRIDFSYYLPALLINGLEGVLTNIDNADTFVGYLVGHLAPDFRLLPGQSRISELNQSQCQVVLEWLDLIAEIFGPSSGIVPTALRDFWKTEAELNHSD